FVGVGENLISLAESVSELRRIVAFGQHVEPASLCFQGMGRTGVALCCEQRGGCAILCGAAGMKTFRHAAEHFLQSDRLARRKPKSPSHPFGIKIEELADGRGRPKHAARAGDMPANIVMRWKHRIADAAFDFNSEN